MADKSSRPVRPSISAVDPGGMEAWQKYNRDMIEWQNSGGEAKEKANLSSKPKSEWTLSDYMTDQGAMNASSANLKALLGAQAAGTEYGKQQYQSPEYQDILKKLKEQESQGIDAASLESVKAKYQPQALATNEMLSKSGVRGSAAMMARSDIAQSQNQAMAAADATIKKQAQEATRDEWGRRQAGIIGYGSMASSTAATAAQLTAAQQPVQTASGGGCFFVCTELNRQGYMSDETYAKDRIWAKRMMRQYPHALKGYYKFSRPLVLLMRRSKFFTEVFYHTLLKHWMEQMENEVDGNGKVNVIGLLFARIGCNVTNFVGSFLTKEFKSIPLLHQEINK